MKTRQLMKVGILAGAILMVSMVLNAQPGQKGNRDRNPGEKGICKFYPDLTQEQENKITALKTQHLKNTQDLRNQLNEKRAHYKTLMTAENPNMGAINNLIDEIAKIKGQLLKAKAAHQQEVRKVLTEDQRVIFDQHISLHNRGWKNNFHGKRKGQGPGGGR